MVGGGCTVYTDAMPPDDLDITTIDTRHDDARGLINALRKKLSPQGDVVTESGRQRTVELFGEPLSPQEVVTRICGDVRREGLPAVLDYTRRLDDRELTAETIRVSAGEFAEAHAAVEPAFLETIRRIRDNIEEFQRAVLNSDVTVRREQGGGVVELRQRVRPLARVGICIPGGTAAYPSTLLMTAVPARVAGVEQLVVVVPPTEFGGYNRELLAVCAELEIDEVYRIGGAQAVAALAFGVEGIGQVDKIVGPGNLFVALAKQHVYGTVDIDAIAGPSEVLVIADESARADFLASDLISQAEHSPGSGVLVTWHEPLISQVRDELTRQLAKLPRGELARDSLREFGALVLVADAREAGELADLFAPEHLHLSTADPETMLESVTNAGAIFLGHHTPVALGDYVAGPSHVLPTGGTARFANGLSANDFLKRSSVIAYDQAALEQVAGDVIRMADVEGLSAHGSSIEVRTSGE